MTITELTLDHYDELIALWQSTPGICIRESDSREATARYLQRNPGLSFVALDQERIVGCAMSGHDGRSGYLQHVVVAPSHRRQGVAHALVTRCLDALAAVGIKKTHLSVLTTNDLANRYWPRRGWERRDDIVRYSIVHSVARAT